ncbi:hypothetical protein DM02DRAFT_527329 [Periconia macrospinosa]|uniref:N-acetyltransferase domain-containing protein n=1 Tax=Periconia macrospinosa TaxID=97972 RepID=A0A2V1DQE6_9PLEO|nr:hypothetical protein DM02DRAFT_527329 [Periconia macrospinosa]
MRPYFPIAEAISTKSKPALLTPKILLVPYSEHHVLTYHEWMQDPELQTLTASEPLTLPEEYAMQKSWRTDADKLTFIVCAAPSAIDPALSIITAGREDASAFMIGDVNLFLTHSDDEGDGEDHTAVHSVIGEIELMIASKRHRGCGLGKEILNVFMWYILESLDGIKKEYKGGNAVNAKEVHFKYLRVKIDKDNVRSIKLFESVGFTRVTEQPNYFGELELRCVPHENSLEQVRGRLGDAMKRLAFKP